jgi:hypothetical protein
VAIEAGPAEDGIDLTGEIDRFPDILAADSARSEHQDEDQ